MTQVSLVLPFTSLETLYQPEAYAFCTKGLCYASSVTEKICSDTAKLGQGTKESEVAHLRAVALFTRTSVFLFMVWSSFVHVCAENPSCLKFLSSLCLHTLSLLVFITNTLLCGGMKVIFSIGIMELKEN